MKQIRKLAVLFAAVAALCLAFFGCSEHESSSYSVEANTETLVVIKATETNVEVSVMDALKELAEAGTIQMEYTNGEWGAYIESINGTVPDAAAHEYWAFYTTLGTYGEPAFIYSTTDFGSYDYQGTICGYAQVGAGSMPMVEGCLYVFTIATW
ncbi:MAG: DUF4430 domain-containing protein [Christensenellaceae bacterium]